MAQNSQEDVSDHSDDGDSDETSIFVYYAYSFRNKAELSERRFELILSIQRQRYLFLFVHTRNGNKYKRIFFILRSGIQEMAEMDFESN